MLRRSLTAAAVALASCSAAPAYCADTWTDQQRVLATALAAATVVDWAQTRYIATHPEYHETNPIIGKHPRIGKVNTYFAASLLGGAIVLDALPSHYRDYALKAGLVLELLVVANNARIGIGMKF